MKRQRQPSSVLEKFPKQRSIDKLGREPTPFELKVYEMAVVIPRGKVTTYGDLAAAINSSSRAVGQALRRNPFAPDVPCHRIVKTSLEIGGFSGTQGDTECVRKKIRLLTEEGVIIKERHIAGRLFVVDAPELQSLALE